MPLVPANALGTAGAFATLPRRIHALSILLTRATFAATLLPPFQLSGRRRWRCQRCRQGIALPMPFVPTNALGTAGAFATLPRRIHTLSILLTRATLATALLPPFQFTLTMLTHLTIHIEKVIRQVQFDSEIFLRTAKYAHILDPSCPSSCRHRTLANQVIGHMGESVRGTLL